MKICPFMSHMLGADGNVLEIDSPIAASPGDVVVLGYDEDSPVGVKTRERTSPKTATEAKPTPHLYCLRETCRFYRARNSECTFDSILESINQQSSRINELSERAREHGDHSDTPDETSSLVARELDKFWQFQTRSVSELISSFGDMEKRQGEQHTKLVSDVEKRIIAFMDDEDVRDERMNTIRDGVAEIKDTIDARNDGFDTLTTTVSDLVMSFEDNLKEIREQSKTMSERLQAIEALASRIDAMESVVSRMESVEKLAAKMVSVDANVALTNENLARLERNWGELMTAVKNSRAKADDPAAQTRRREAMKFNNLGVTSFHNGDLSLARDHFLEAVNRDDSFAECYNNLGLVYTELGESDRAADAFSKAITLNADLHAAYNNLGYVYYKKGEYHRAIEMYNEALARSSNNSSAYTNLGNAYYKLGDHEEARKAWEKAVDLDPANETAQRSLKNLG